LLGYFAAGAADRAGIVGDAALSVADRSVGIYKACQLFAFLPYQLLVSVTFILFPMLAKAHAEDDAEAVKSYVRTGMRLAMVMTGAMVAVVVGLAPGLLGLVFPRELADAGGPTLRVLALGQGAFALFAIATTVLSSLHRERWTMALNAVATVLVVGAAFAIVPGTEPGAPIAARAALATSVALVASLGIAGVLVVRVAGALVSPLTVVRVVIALLVAGGAPTLLGHTGKLATLGLSAVIGLVYLVVLVVTGELGKADLGLIRRVLGKRAAS
jgi:stage V sporulation protein B